MVSLNKNNDEEEGDGGNPSMNDRKWRRELDSELVPDVELS
jgi:hypothetical protein